MAILSILVGLGLVALALARVRPLGLHREHAHRDGTRARDRLLAVRHLALPRGTDARAARRTDAIGLTGATASRAVLFSGSTFVVALFGMLLVPTTIMRSLAAGAIIVGVVSVVAALTLLPALLEPARRPRQRAARADPRPQPRPCRAAPRAASGARSSRPSCAGPSLSLVLSAGLLIAAGRPDLRPAHRRERRHHAADDLPSKQGYVALQRNVPGSEPLPGPRSSSRAGTTRRREPTSPAEGAARRRPALRARLDPDRARAASRCCRCPCAATRSAAPRSSAVRDLRKHLLPEAFAGTGARVFVGGKTAENADYFDAVTNPTPYVLAFVLGLSFVVLTVAFRSIVVALVSILLNLLSVGAAYGLLTLVFLRRLRRRTARLPARPRDRRLGAAVPLLRALRPLDGLPGLPDEPDQGTLRPERLHPRRRHLRASPPRPGSSPAPR